MKKLLVCLLLLAGCGMYGPNTDNFVPYEPDEASLWVNKLEEFYYRPLPRLYDVQWYYGTRERVLEECSSDRAGACVWGDGTILMTDRYRESCLMGLHELMHLAMIEAYGDSDGGHTREDWSKVWDLCGEI